MIKITFTEEAFEEYEAIVLVPADSIKNLFSKFFFLTISLNKNSAIGDLQIFPKHTNKTFITLLFSIPLMLSYNNNFKASAPYPLLLFSSSPIKIPTVAILSL